MDTGYVCVRVMGKGGAYDGGVIFGGLVCVCVVEEWCAYYADPERAQALFDL